MKKSLFVGLLTLALVLSSAGVCFADDLSSYFQLSSPYLNVTFSEDSIVFNTSSGYVYTNAQGNFIAQVNFSNVSSSSNLLAVSTSSSLSISDNLGCALNANGVLVSSASSGSFTVNYTANNNITFYSAGSGTTFSFDSLTIGSNSIISPIVGEVIDFSIQPGYAFIIDGSCEVLERSYYINNSWNFTTNENSRVNGSIERNLGSSSIRDGFSPDRLKPRSELIQWEALNPNIFGKASNYEYYNGDLLTVGTGEVFLISYPTLYGFGTADSNITYQNSVNMICSVYIQYSERPTFRFVAIESLSEFTSSGSFSTYSVFRPDVADVEGDSSEGSGGTVITPESSLPSDGGNNGQPSVNDDNSQLGTISKLVNDIKGLFSNAVEGITELVNTGSSFMQSIGAMFTWLPSPVLSIIIAGFTVLLVVGVLKVLWR